MSWRQEPELFLMSYPRHDWGIRGASNFRSVKASSGASLAGQAMRDWLEIADAIEGAGGHVIVLPPSQGADLTGLPYTAEAGHIGVDDKGQPFAWLPNMTHPHRQGESLYLEGMWAALNMPCRRVPGVWEGQGDAIRIDKDRVVHTFGRGSYARSQDKAYPVIASSMSATHCLLAFEADPWFHGNTFLGVYWHASTHAPQIIWCPQAMPAAEQAKLKAFVGDIPMHEVAADTSRNYATNALQVGQRVIAPKGLSPEVHAIWQGLELEIVELELSALFVKGGGAAVCLTNRLYGLTLDRFPKTMHYAAQRESLHALAGQYA